MNLFTAIIRSRITWAVLCLCSIIFILFWPVFIQGKVIVPGDIPYYDAFFQSEPYVRLKTPLNLSVSDQIEQFYVWHKIAANSMQSEGHIPLWNPYEFTGQPLVANAQSALFYPPNLLLFFLSPAKVATANKIFILLISGIFTFLFCRELKVSDLGAIFTSIAFTFSGPLITFLGHPHANVLAFFPMMMWSGEKLLRYDDRPRSCALLGFAMGAALLGGHPETTFYCWVVFAIYFSARILFDRSIGEKISVFFSFLSAAIIGVLIGGIQLLPFAEALLQSSTLNAGRSIAGVVEMNNPFSIKEFLNNIPQLITLICPNFYGNPVDWSYLWPFASLQSYSDRAIYFGTIPLSLAIGAIFTVPKRQPWIVIPLLALFCIGVAWHFPVLEAVNHLPLFSKGISLRLTFQFTFFAAVMAGIGFDILHRHLTATIPHKRFLYLCLSSLLVPLLVILIIAAINVVPLLTAIPANLLNYIPPHEFRTYFPAIIVFAVMLSYYLCLKIKLFRGFFLFSIFALTVIELVGFAWGYNPTVKEEDILPDIAPVKLMQAEGGKVPFRILRTNEILHANYSAAYEIADISGYDAPIYQRYEDIYRSQGGTGVRDRQYWKPDWPLIDFLNVKYILSDETLDARKFAPVYQTDSFKIYENKNVLPRAFMVFESEVIPDSKKILEQMTSLDYNFGRKVILEESPQSQLARPKNENTAYSIKYMKYFNDEVIMGVSCDSPGMLVMSDLYTPDWKASIDNVQTKIYRANYAFRSVNIPAGTHTITFTYSPLSYKIGAAMTLIGILVCLVMVSIKMSLPGLRSNY
jgi:hypothetical protein